MVLASGTALAQAIMVLASPLLTRLYTPEDLGVVAVFFAIPFTIRSTATLQYEGAILVNSDDALAMALVVLSFSILVIFCILIGLLISLVGEDIARLANVPQLVSYTWMIPFLVFFLGATQIAQVWTIRRKGFRRISAAELSQAASSVTIQIAFGLANWTPLGMVVGRVVGIIASNLAFMGPLLRDARVLCREISLARIGAAARMEWRFPAFAGPSEVFRGLSAHSPSILLAWLIGPQALGLYVLADRMLSLPIAFIAEHVRKIFLSSAVEARRDGALPAVTEKLTEALLRVSLPLLAVFAISVPDLFALIFGKTWRESGHYAAILSPMLCAMFVAAPFSQVPMIFRRQSGELLFQAILLASRVAAIVVGGLLLDARGTIILFSVAGTACWIGFMLWVLSLAGSRPRRVLGVALRETTYALPFVGPLLLMGHVPVYVQSPQYTMAAAAFVCGALAFGLSTLRLKRFMLRMSS